MPTRLAACKSSAFTCTLLIFAHTSARGLEWFVIRNGVFCYSCIIAYFGVFVSYSRVWLCPGAPSVSLAYSDVLERVAQNTVFRSIIFVFSVSRPSPSRRPRRPRRAKTSAGVEDTRVFCCMRMYSACVQRVFSRGRWSGYFGLVYRNVSQRVRVRMVGSIRP